MDITAETWSKTERKLRALMPTVSVERLGDHYILEAAQLTDETFATSLALVYDGAAWSALRRSVDATPDREDLGVFAIRFRPGSKNSGFVAWLCKQIKERTGSGAIVVCGFEDGEIFDYYAVPASIADEVETLIEELRQQPKHEIDRSTLCGKYKVMQIDDLSEISEETVFNFDFGEDYVSAVYSGGPIACGVLVGHWRIANEVSFRYEQVAHSGRRASGSSTLSVEYLASGKIRLTEQYTYSGGGSGVNILQKSEEQA